MSITSFKQMHRDIDDEIKAQWVRSALKESALVGSLSFLLGLLSGLVC